MLVKCKRSGLLYDPKVRLKEALALPEIIAVLKRLKDK